MTMDVTYNDLPLKKMQPGDPSSWLTLGLKELSSSLEMKKQGSLLDKKGFIQLRAVTCPPFWYQKLYVLIQQNVAKIWTLRDEAFIYAGFKLFRRMNSIRVDESHGTYWSY